MDAREGTQVWGNQYNRRRADLLAAQAELSGEIARQLRLKLTPVNQQQLTKRDTVNAEAYELVLRGRAQREKGSPENLKRAVELFKSAISIDPSYALPHAELSIIYGLLTSSNLLNPKEYRPQAQAEARQALALDANLADAHYAMANVEMDIWNWPAAAAAFDRALELNPSLARARWRHALYLSIMGQHDQAIAEIERARELNPLSPRFKAYVSIMLLNAHRIDEGIKVLQNTLALDPNSREALTGLGYAYLAKGMYAEAISYYQKAIKLGYTGTSTQIYLGAAYARGGERNKALAILKRLQTSKEYVSPGELTVLYVALGQREEAFASLERAYAERDVQLGGLGHEPGFDPVRSDPRFINLMQRVGLPL
jgi:tetratricopeptide (TPR) repeat protein